MRTLTEFNQAYEDIIHHLKEPRGSLALADLMTELEGLYKIPMVRKPEWEQENKTVIALYRKISISRDL